MPTPKHDFDANVVNGKIYLSGLVLDNRWPNVNTLFYNTFKVTNVTEVYDPATDSWTAKAPIPNVVCNYVSGVLNNKIFIISESLTQIYDPETDNWSFGFAPPFPVDNAGGATIAGIMPQRIYVIDGRRFDLEVAYNQVYNPETDSWSIGVPMPTARFGLAVAVVNNKIYTIGGSTGMYYNVVQTDLNEQYDPLKDQPIPATLSTSPTPSQEATSTPESGWVSLQTTLAAVACAVGIAVVSAGLLVFFKRRKH